MAKKPAVTQSLSKGDIAVANIPHDGSPQAFNQTTSSIRSDSQPNRSATGTTSVAAALPASLSDKAARKLAKKNAAASRKKTPLLNAARKAVAMTAVGSSVDGPIFGVATGTGPMMKKLKTEGATSDRQRRELKKINKEVRQTWNELVTEKLFAPEQEGTIETEHLYERTVDLTQGDILKGADEAVRSKVLDLNLEYGDYSIDITNDGQFGLLGGKKGHVGLVDLRTNTPLFDKNLLQTIRQVKFLFNESFWAVAGKNYVSIFDRQAVEIHCFKHEKNIRFMDFLPYHALLVSWGLNGDIRWRDVSTGQFAGTHLTHVNNVTSLKQSPSTAVTYLSDGDGNVSLWVPSSPKPGLKFHAHPHCTAVQPLSDVYCATAGLDHTWKVYDIRKAESPVNFWRAHGQPITSMDATATGLLAMSHGGHVEIWKDVHLAKGDGKPVMPYLRERPRGDGAVISSLKFRPFEDVLFLGTSHGVRSMLVPGAGLANLDSFTFNPLATSKEKSKDLIRRLVEKLPADSIALKLNRISRSRGAA